MDGIDAAAAADAASAAAKLKARSGGRRRSCNRCSAKKERCDGQEPCQRCTRSGLECLYASCRTLGRPRNASPPPKRRSKAAAATGAGAGMGMASAAGATTSSSRGGHGGRGAAAAKKGRSGGSATAASRVAPRGAHAPEEADVGSRKVAGHGHEGTAGGTVRAREEPAGRGSATAPAVSALKRLSLSPSPATGLTGLVQNRYLTCFVDNFSGFFQVLDEVTIRLGLINLMSGKVDPTELVEASDDPNPLPKRRRNGKAASRFCRPSHDVLSSASSSPPQAGGRRSQQVTSATVGAVAAAAAEGEEQEVVNAINSSVFSAMSLGAMLLGQPPSHVHVYVAVAEASLRLCWVTKHLAMAVPNEHVAAAALLLAFAANISGREEYRLHIHLARQCYDRRVRHGLPTPPPIRDSLGYRAIIDALGKPPDDRGLRIPSPSKESRVSLPQPSCPSKGSGVGSSGGGSSCSSNSSSSDSGGGSSMASPGAGGGLDGQPTTHGAGGSGATGAAAASGGGGEVTALHDASRGSGNLRDIESASTCRPGLEAARERRRLRKADPMSMVSDIMTMLSRVPWTAHVEEAASTTKRELGELRSLMIAEKALAEERRYASGQTKRRSDGVAMFALASASIGLHCALDEFSELLRLGREVASCIHYCPGLARYQPHAYHAGLVILAAFGKRKEFEDLLGAAPAELRLSASSRRPLTFEAHSDTCSHPVCRKHAKAISEMGRRLRSEGAGPQTATSSSVTVEEIDLEEEEKNRDPARGQAESHSLSGKVSIQAAAAAPAGAGSPPPRWPGATQQEKFAGLVLRLPSPPESPGAPSSYDESLPQQGPSSPAASAAAGPVEPVVDHDASATSEAKGVSPCQARKGEASVGAGGQRTWSPELASSWSTPPSASQDSSSPEKNASELSPTAAPLSSAASLEESGEVFSSSSPLQAGPAFTHVRDRRLGALSAAATAMAATPAQPAAGRLDRTRRVEGGRGGSGGPGSESLSGGTKRSRVATAAANGFAASGEGSDIASRARNAQGRTARRTNARKSGGNNTTGSSGSSGVHNAYLPYQLQQQGSNRAAPPTNPVSAHQDDHSRAAPMMVMSQQPVPAPVAQAVAVDSSGVRALHAAAPAGGTLTWRLWGTPRSSLAARNSGLASAGAGASLSCPSVQNNPHVASPGIPRPWQWHGPVPPTSGFAPSAPSALSGSLLGGAPVVPPAAARAALFQGSTQQGLSSSGIARLAGMGLAAPRPGMVGVSLPSSSFTTSGPSTAIAPAPAVSSRPTLMTAGEASAAAISLAALAGAGASNQAGSTTGSRKAGTGAVTAAAAAAEAAAAAAASPAAPAADAPGTDVQEVSRCAGEGEAGEVEPHEEEMMALWEIIGTGDSE